MSFLARLPTQVGAMAVEEAGEVDKEADYGVEFSKEGNNAVGEEV